MAGQIRHILFDLGNVLVSVNSDKAFADLIPHLPPDMAELLKKDRAAFIALMDEPAVALETGRIEFREYHRHVCALLGISMSFEQFRVIWCDLFEMNTDMVRLGEHLSATYQTWLVSNTSRAHYEWIIEKFPRVVFYEKAALSFELGVMKPAREYYEKALKLFGIEADQAIFIDDLEENVAGARQCGIMGVVFRGRNRLVADLNQAGVRLPWEPVA